MRKNLLITPVAMTLVAGAISLSAQDLSNGTVAGRVTGANGQPLSGVSVTLNSPALLTPRQFTTDASGQFRAQMLLAGNYTITYTLNGYVTRRLTTYVAAGQTIRGDMQLRPIEVQGETVEIMAASAQHVDKTDTLAVVAMNQEKITELMGWLTLGGDGLVSIVPGVLRSGDDYMMRGATQRGTKVLVDGGNATNMMEGTPWGFSAPITDALESMSFVLSPLNARYGNTDGGLVSFVLNKGSNNFKGTLRFIPGGRGSMWNTINPSYPDNRGMGVANPTPGSDQMTKRYEFYLSGPLWKDHITFSYSSRNTPATRTTRYQYEQTGGIWVSGNGTTIEDKARFRVGTYFTNPKTNETIRKAEMLDASDPMTLIPVSNVTTNDTYTLYYQITQNHQIEYSYTELQADGWNNRTDVNSNMADTSYNRTHTPDGNGNQRRWNIAYKGIIGSAGLLEARMSAFTQTWFNLQEDGRPKHHVRVLTMPSLLPMPGKANNNDPNNYYASGLIDAMLNRQDSIKDTTLGGTSSYYFNASNEGPGDTGRNDPINVNYQHILETKSFGRHIFDVGFAREKSSWTNPNLNAQGGINAERVIYTPGRINIGLTANDIYGYANTPLRDYAGKFIVFNMKNATFNSIDPYGFSRYNKAADQNEPRNGNDLLINYYNAQNIRAGNTSAAWPMMYEQYGDMLCELSIQQLSYYLNDLWTINDHHSVMAGVRFDNFKVWESKANRDIHSYSQPTFRFEYKFDVNGDQKRVANLSWAQYHTLSPISSWVGFVNRGVRTRTWDQGSTDGVPYLVDFEDIMNINNYGYVLNDSYFGAVNEVDKDYKGLVRTELTTGMRFNLDNGGHLRVTYIQSSFDNESEYSYNGWKPNPNGNGTMSYSRKLVNIPMERSYKSIELEWEVPVTKRVLFGGSYMFARKMENAPNSDFWSNESNVPQKNLNKRVYYWDAYDQFEWPGFGWNPIRMKNSEHQLNAYLNYDLSAGKVKSNVAFRWWYTSSGFEDRIGYDCIKGYPIIPGINEIDNAGTGMKTLPGGAEIYNYRWIYTDTHSLRNGADGWGLRMNYNLDLPITKKLHWFLSVLVENPFNHRQKSGWFDIGWWSDGRNTPNDVLDINGNVVFRATTQYTGGVKKMGMNTDYSHFAPNQITGGRSMSFQTGLRF